MRVVYSSLALADLQHIHAQIAEDNPAAARRIVRRIRHSTRRLSSFPKSGRKGVVEGTSEPVVPGTPYIVVYTLRENRVEIMAVIHGAQDRS